MTFKNNSAKSKIIFLFCFISSINLYSQNYIGLNGSIGLYKVSATTPQTDFALKPGAGVNFLHQFDNHLRFTIGVNFMPLGFKSSYTTTNNVGQVIGKTTLNYNINYLSAPVLIGYTFGFEKLNIYSNLGVVPAYLLNVSYKVDDNKTKQTTTDFNKVDILARFNVGTEFKLSDKLLFNIDANIQKGFIPISDVIISPYNESRNLGGFMSIGLKYRL